MRIKQIRGQQAEWGRTDTTTCRKRIQGMNIEPHCNVREEGRIFRPFETVDHAYRGKEKGSEVRGGVG